ncbi:MAG: hypothetical protein P8X95_18420 [Anaerolineales bacterium]|jgi:hypothetical protein
MKPFLLFLACLLPLTACAPSASAPEPSTAASGASEIQVAVAGNDFAVGAPRLPLVLYAGPERGAPAQKVSLVALDLSTEPATQSWEGEATAYSDYFIPYWVAYPELSHAGNWGFRAKLTLDDGKTAQAQFAIQINEQSSAPSIGSLPPASKNRTLQSDPDIKKLTSDIDPNPALYQLTVAEALNSDRPAVVTFATPGFCTSQLCAPVVDSIKTVYTQFKDQVNFIHIEVYKSFDPLVYADEMAEWGLTSEPWTFVIDRTGKIASKFVGPVSPEELTQALDLVLN